jgi:hypothetical protein
MFFPGCVQQYHVRPDLPDERKNLVIHRAAIGRAHKVGVQRRNARTGGQLRNAEVSRLLSLAQAGQQRSSRRIAPDQNQRTPVALDAGVGKRRLTAEIEQAFVNPPLVALGRHAGHGADFRRQPEVEAAPPDDRKPGDRDHRHAGPEADHLAPARQAETERYLDKPIGRPGQERARQQYQVALQQRQRPEFDHFTEYQ